MKKTLRFWYDVVCPYAYLASTQVEQLSAELGVAIEWRPMLLGGVFRHTGAPQVPAAQMSPSKALMNSLELYRWAQAWGVPFRFSPHHPQRSVEAMRLLCLCPQALRPKVSLFLYERYWVRGERLDEEGLAEACALAGLSAEAWKSEEAKRLLFSETARAAELGVFGAPTFEVAELGEDGVERSELYWGQDRLDHVRAAMGAPPAPLEARPAPTGTEVILYHDLASPFSYLASTQAARVIALTGAKLSWRPILLGALFKELGAPNVPLFEMSAAKRRYMSQELTRWASWWGVPFSFPERFPLRTPTPLRLCLLKPELTPLLYRLAWVEGVDIGDEERLLTALLTALPERSAELQALLDDTKRPELKAQLKANTDEAYQRGVFGVPSFELRRPDGPPALFWGQDRLKPLYEALTAPEPALASIPQA